jgi:hypothetical protein
MLREQTENPVPAQFVFTIRRARLARSIPNVAMDAWLAGGADLHVLVRDDEYFTVSAQMWSQTHPIPSGQGHEFFVRAGELLTTIARAIVARL